MNLAAGTDVSVTESIFGLDAIASGSPIADRAAGPAPAPVQVPAPAPNPALGQSVHRRTFPARLDEVGRARRFLTGVLGGSPVAEAAELVLGELGANAVMHSRSRLPGGSFTVRATVESGRLLLEVTDLGGPWATPATGGPDPVRAGRDGAGRDGAGRDGAGRDGAGRDGAGRDGAGRGEAESDTARHDAAEHDAGRAGRAGLDEEAGRGLQIVSQLVSLWGVVTAAGGRTVWCEFNVAG